MSERWPTAPSSLTKSIVLWNPPKNSTTGEFETGNHQFRFVFGAIAGSRGGLRKGSQRYLQLVVATSKDLVNLLDVSLQEKKGVSTV